MNVARSITHNLGAKLLALLVALLVWFNASGQEQGVRMRSASLVVEGVSDSLALSSAVPSSAQLRITGTRRQLLVVGFRRLVVTADLSGLGAGRQRMQLTGNNVRGAGSLESSQVQVVAPGYLDLELEPLATRRLQVSLETTGALPGNLALLDDGIVVEPSWVTVRGPASDVERYQHVSTEPVDLGRIRDSGTRDVALRSRGRALVFEPDRVSVTFRVSPRGERVLPNVPPTILLDSDEVDAIVEPSTVSLTLDGPSAVLDTLSSGDVSVLLSVSGPGGATYRLVPDVILPPGIRLVAISADTFEVHVVPAQP